MKKYILYLLPFAFYLLPLQNANAQSFKWYSSIEKVHETAFYNVYLNPAVTSKLRYELPDIRLFDEKNNENPFILRLDRTYNYAKKIKKLEIIKNKYNFRKGLRQVIVENKWKDEITNFTVHLKNTDAVVTIKLSGSYDKKHWYILKNSSAFHIKLNDKEQVEIVLEDIPENDFKYYSFEISGNNKQKLDVKAVYFRKLIHVQRNYMQLISPEFTQDNSSISGKSIITINFEKPEFIDKLMFRFNDEDYFLRKATILKTDTVGEKKINLQQFDRTKKEIIISSSTKNEILFANFKAQQIRIEIENQDDNPLELTSVRAYQLNAYLIAHLDKNKEYTLRFGSKNVAAPLYDLNYFTDSIPLELAMVEVGKVYPNLEDGNLSYKFKMPVYILWFLAIAIVLFFGFMVFKLFKVIE